MIAAELEASEGVAQTLDGTEANLRILEADYRLIVPTFQRPTLGDVFTPNAPTSPGNAQGEITFTTELAQPTANSGAAGGNLTASLAMAPYLIACGMQEIDNTVAMKLPSSWDTSGFIGHGETIENATESETTTAVGHTGEGFRYLWMNEPTTFADWTSSDTLESPADASNAAVDASGKESGQKKTYVPDSSLTTNNSSLTIAIFHDGKKFELKGARGNFSLSGTFGETVRVTFTFRGILSEEVDEAIPTASITDQIPPSFAAVEAVVSSEADGSNERDFEFSTFSFDLGNELQTWTDASSDDGYSCTAIVSRTPVLRLNPSHKLEASGFDWLGAFEAGTPLGIEMHVGDPDGTAGTAFGLAWGGCVITDAPDGDREGLEILDVTASPSMGTRAANGDGEFALHLF